MMSSVRRLARYTLNALTALSLLLCVATGCAWVQSHKRAQAAAFARGSGMMGVVSSRGSLLFWRTAATQRAPTPLARPTLLYARGDDAGEPWWLNSSDATALMTELTVHLRTPSCGIGDGLRSLEVRPVGWTVRDFGVINRRHWVVFDTQVDSGIKKGDTLTLIQSSPFKVLGLVTVYDTRFDVPGEDGSANIEWFLTPQEQERRQQERRAKASSLSVIGHVTWTATRPRSAALYAVRDVAPVGIKYHGSFHGLLYLRGWAFGLERTLVALPHYAVAAFFAALAIPLPVKAFRYLRSRNRGRHRQCLCCGYSLTGNVSGVCPECGTKVGAA